VDFALDDDTDQVCLTGTTLNKNISAVYSASSIPNSAPTTTSSSPTTTKTSAGSSVEPLYFGIQLLILLAMVVFLYMLRHDGCIS